MFCERKMKKQERETEKESTTFASSRSLLGRGDLRGTLGHQSNTLREGRACLSYRLGFLSILWWEKGDWRWMGIRKNDCIGEWGKVLDIIRKVIGAAQPAIRVAFLWLFYRRQPCFNVFQYYSILGFYYIYLYLYLYI
jgi:hypothetical protein